MTPLFAQAAGSNSALITFAIYTLAVFGLAYFSHRLLQSKSFLSEYFLGSRNLGMWAFALTFAATSSSGGSFTGFPSKIYTHGWILALWIASYMVVPICTMGILGKRLNQVARISGAITIPDVIRDRFGSHGFGTLAILFIVFFMSFNLVGQFKAGSLILVTLLKDVPAFEVGVGWTKSAVSGIELLRTIDPAYLLCLFAFAAAVILYTTYGGFHAVVWTDVLQGAVMFFGVILLLPLALWTVGGMQNATEKMKQMTPPRKRTATLTLAAPLETDYVLPRETWLRVPDGDDFRLLRVNQATFPAGQQQLNNVRVVEITTEFQREQIEPTKLEHPVKVARLSASADLKNATGDPLELPPESWLEAEGPEARTVVLQLQSELTLQPGEQQTNVELWEVLDPSSSPSAAALEVGNLRLGDYRAGAGQKGAYISGPGPDPDDVNGFLPFSLAISFFFMWAISGAGQPSNMVRLMAFRNSRTLRWAIATVCVYYTLIYVPLVVIFCCSRVFLPGMEQESDRIMPAAALYLCQQINMTWLAGLLVAAPFAAVMSTVDSFLLMISSAVVRDVYQRNINPQASEKQIKYLSYIATFVVGAGATLGAINPPEYLQDIIVYCGSGLAACFLAPTVLGVFWPRINVAGAASGMVGGFAIHLALYVIGFFVNGRFSAYRLLNMDPIIWGLLVSFGLLILVTLITPPPPEHLVRRYFYRRK